MEKFKQQSEHLVRFFFRLKKNKEKKIILTNDPIWHPQKKSNKIIRIRDGHLAFQNKDLSILCFIQILYFKQM